MKKLSKGKTLIYFEDKLKKFKVPKTLVINIKDWKIKKNKILNDINIFFLKDNYFDTLAIRSSAYGEDSSDNSNAGAYDSFLNIETNDKKKIENCINKIIAGYKEKKINLNKSEVIIQQMIQNTYLSGVIFTHNLNNGAPYYVINYDDISGLTNTVTSGASEYSNRSLYIYRNKINKLKSPRFRKIINCVRELENISRSKFLDIEFACDKNLNIFLLQVREIAKAKPWNKNLKKKFNKTLLNTNSKILNLFRKKDINLIGKTTIFGQMPDWNPAEMIGKTPRSLSISLYEKLITNHIWSDAREKMGYKKLKQKKLMQSFAGQPYIDVRLSLNSFIPQDLSKNISSKLINYWLEKLKNNPTLHDKIEFDLAVTCFSFDIKEKFKKLIGSTLNDKEKKDYIEKLKKLTIKCIDKNSDFSVEKSLKKVEMLKNKQLNFSKNRNLEELNILINDCKKFGVLPFAILARHAFISTTIIKSFETLNILTSQEIQNFLKSIKTITSEMVDDLDQASKRKNFKIKFNKKYGHLRPGTYDIMSKRYDEKNYFDFNRKKKDKKNKFKFNFTKTQRRKIEKLLLRDKFNNINFDILINYIKNSIAAREYSKFIFTKSVSQILSIITNYSKAKKIKTKYIANLPISYLSKKNITIKDLKKLSSMNEKLHKITQSIKLPQIIHKETSPFIAPFQINIPNFITTKKVEGLIKIVSSETLDDKIDNKIVLIEGADPGYDWIFTHKIKGLITKFGGANSHMAIRSSEFGIPAAIGCGENIYNNLIINDFLILNCEDKTIKPIKIN
tara:strand:- start:10911 stop:13277 length:2367 start_codon:yes stop_codon:yes gene_type:complete